MDVEALIQQIKDGMQTHKLTYQQMADASGVPKSTVIRILSGSTDNPSAKALLDMLAVVQPPSKAVVPEGMTLEAQVVFLQALVDNNERRHRDVWCLCNAQLAARRRTQIALMILCAVLLTIIIILCIILGMDRAWHLTHLSM